MKFYIFGGTTSCGSLQLPVRAQGQLVKYSPWLVYLTLLGQLPPFRGRSWSS